MEQIEHTANSPDREEVQVNEEEDDTSVLEEGDVVDMVGLEDLSLNMSSHVQGRSPDRIGMWA